MAEENDPVEHLKDELYSRSHKDAKKDVRAPLTPEESEAPVVWKDMPPREPKPFISTPESRMSFAAKFFIVSVGFFFVAIAVAGVAFFFGPNTISPNNIAVSVVAPSLVDSGKETQFQILIDNKNPAPLQLVDLIIDYPPGTRDPKNPSQSLLHERQDIGTIGAASEIKRTSSALLYGSQGAQQTVRATIEYSLEGSNAVFTRSGETIVTIGQAPVSVVVDTPSETIAGQVFGMDVEVRSNATSPIDNVAVQGVLPFGYSLKSSSPKADAGTVWRLGKLSPGESQTIHLEGSLDGVDGDSRVFKFVVGTSQDPSDTTIKVPLLVMPATVTVSKPFITAALSINGQTQNTTAAQAGEEVRGTISWQNNLSTPIQNLQVTLKLNGPMINKNQINAGTGFYRSSDNSIVWTPDQDPSLASAAPGGTGQLSFSFGTLPPGQGGVVYANPQATLALSIEAQRPGESGVPGTVTAAAQSKVNFASQATLSASVEHVSGPRPPVPNVATTYLMRWTVKNSSNSLGAVSVSTVLPPYSSFVSGASGITYDAPSRTVTWAIGDLRAGVGYTSPAQSATFQVNLLPSTSQVGNAPALTGASQLTATDRFASVKITASAPAIQVDTIAPGQ